MKRNRQNSMNKKENFQQNIFVEVSLSIFFASIIVFSFLVLFGSPKSGPVSTKLGKNHPVSISVSGDLRKGSLVRKSN
jgi:hypothetical protein